MIASLALAAALPCAGLTAYQALVRKMNIQAGRSIFIQGGSGGVGSFAILIAKALGLQVISSCSTKNLDYVSSLGADVAIVMVCGPRAHPVLCRRLSRGTATIYANDFAVAGRADVIASIDPYHLAVIANTGEIARKYERPPDALLVSDDVVDTAGALEFVRPVFSGVGGASHAANGCN